MKIKMILKMKILRMIFTQSFAKTEVSENGFSYKCMNTFHKESENSQSLEIREAKIEKRKSENLTE